MKRVWLVLAVGAAAALFAIVVRLVGGDMNENRHRRAVQNQVAGFTFNRRVSTHEAVGWARRYHLRPIQVVLRFRQRGRMLNGFYDVHPRESESAIVAGVNGITSTEQAGLNPKGGDQRSIVWTQKPVTALMVTGDIRSLLAAQRDALVGSYANRAALKEQIRAQQRRSKQ